MQQRKASFGFRWELAGRSLTPGARRTRIAGALVTRRRPTPTLLIAIVALASSLTGTAIATSRDPFVANCLTASEPVSQYTDASGRTYLDAQHKLGQPHLYVMLVKPSCVTRPKTVADLAWRWPAPAKPEGQVSRSRPTSPGHPSVSIPTPS